MNMRATCCERFRKTKDGRRVSNGWYVFTYDDGKQTEHRAKSRESAEAIGAQVANAETTLRPYSHWVQPETEDMGFLKLVGSTG